MKNTETTLAAPAVADPGLYQMSHALYHADPAPIPSLSATIAKLLVNKSPAHARAAHPRLGARPAETDEAMDLGSVAHEIVLGAGGGFAVSPFDDFRTKDARAWRDEQRAAGKTVVTKDQFERASEMKAALHDQLEAMKMPTALRAGVFEQPVFWQERDVWCRALLDNWDLETATIFDYKTTTSAHLRAIQGRVIGMGYDLQDQFYRRGMAALFPAINGRIRFVFVFQETTYPYVVVPVELNGEAQAIGLSKTSRAIDLWRECLGSDNWPGYVTELTRIEPPTWALNAEMSET